MEKRFLIDTSAVIKFLNESFPMNSLEFLDEILDKECTISFITQIELLAWDQSKENNEIVKEFVFNSEILGFDQSIIERTIEIRKISKIKLPDALIAATAIEHNLTLLADNDKDFKKVERLGLKYINPKSFLA
jgi:predicted nucleic acid-binding protein